MTRIIFVRHGESQGNLEERFYGHTDGPLTEKGKRQAEMTASYLKDTKIDIAYASDLKRAYETGSIIAKPHGLTPIPDERIREIFAGEWENGRFYDLLKSYPETFGKWIHDLGNACPDGGESVRELYARVNAEVWKIAEENEGKTVLIATHATPIRALACTWRGQPAEAMKDIMYVQNASVSIVDYDVSAHTTNVVTYDEASFMGDIATSLPDRRKSN